MVKLTPGIPWKGRHAVIEHNMEDDLQTTMVDGFPDLDFGAFDETTAPLRLWLATQDYVIEELKRIVDVFLEVCRGADVLPLPPLNTDNEFSE